MGHRDIATTMIYADYQPRPEHAALVERAFEVDDPGRGPGDADPMPSDLGARLAVVK